MGAQADTTRDDGGTRERLLRAGVEVFGRLGYDGTGTRALARAAGVNLSAIPYHFGGKRQLYVAVAEHIAGRILLHLGPTLERIEGDLARLEADRRRGRRARRAGALELLHTLLDDFAAMLVRPEVEDWARFIIREQMAPSEAFDVLFDRVMSRLLGLITRLIARVSGRSAEAEATRLQAVTMFAQVLVFRSARAAAMRGLGWREVGPRELRALQRTVRHNVDAILGVERGT